ncbi:MAG: aromatic aminobenezylarsenical efflux permease ArsG family transporter [Bacteroidales bacterium]|nr:aromatic aminobenezylarsenical efflux permease ArsG family transporter [Bacteroidales bacterium]
MEILQQFLENSEYSIVSAFILGLMTAISPCPLATNITAIAYVGKNIEDKRQVFFNGLIYTLGRSISYTLIGIIFFLGANQFNISSAFQEWGEKLLGPLLIIIGLMMLGVFKLKLFSISNIIYRYAENRKTNFMSVLLIGVLFALAFCPYSGILYFGILIPMTVVSIKGLFLPVVFAIATGLPVIIFAYLLAFTISGISRFYNRIQIIEKWLRYITAILFIVVGMYYVILFFI